MISKESVGSVGNQAYVYQSHESQIHSKEIMFKNKPFYLQHDTKYRVYFNS